MSRSVLKRTPYTSKIESFATIVNDLNPLTIVAKISMLDVRGGLATSLISSGIFAIFPFEINQFERISDV